MSLEYISSQVFSSTTTKILGYNVPVGSEHTDIIMGIFLKSIVTLLLSDRVRLPTEGGNVATCQH